MINDVTRISEIGADGIVIGALTKNGDVDMEAMKALCDVANTFKLSVTFHR